MHRSLLVSAALLALSLFAVPAQAQARVEVGALRCRGVETTNYLIVSTHRMRCVFQGLHGYREFYVAEIDRFGFDLSINERSLLVWRVFAPTRSFAAGALAGNYGGVSAGAAVGVGAAANVLVGGSNESFALQPLSLQAQRGFNVTATVTELRLRPR